MAPKTVCSDSARVFFGFMKRECMSLHTLALLSSLGHRGIFPSELFPTPEKWVGGQRKENLDPAGSWSEGGTRSSCREKASACPSERERRVERRLVLLLPFASVELS